MRGVFPPPGLAWIQAASHKLGSTRALPRHNSLVSSPRLETGSRPPITLQILTRLALLVEFLGENHRREEGLYRREGPRVETQDLLEYFLTRDLPDLVLYNPHSITAVVKQCLSERFEPLVPYTISARMLEASEDSADGGRQVIFATFKQINSASREFLKLFLLHLQHVSTVPACRMSAKHLAAHVGLLLIRPSEDKNVLASKQVQKQRQHVAQILIEHASSLPYDCATEMELEAIPDHSNDAKKTGQPEAENRSQESAENINCMGRNKSDRTEVSEKETRATPMYPTPTTTQGGEASRHFSSDYSMHEPLFKRRSDALAYDAASKMCAAKRGEDATGISKASVARGTRSSRAGSIIVEDYDSDTPEASVKLLDVSSLTAAIAMETCSEASLPTNHTKNCTSKDSLISGATSQHLSSRYLSRRGVDEKNMETTLTRTGSVGGLENRGRQQTQSALVKTKSGFMTEIRGILARRTSKPDLTSQTNKLQESGDEGTTCCNFDPVKTDDIMTSDTQSLTFQVGADIQLKLPYRGQEQRDQATQTNAPNTVFLVDRSTITDETELEERPGRDDAPVDIPLATQDVLQRKLLDMRMLLSTADAALYASPPFTEASQALHQLLSQTLGMIDDAIGVLASQQDDDLGPDAPPKSSLLEANKEFLDFLEIQSKSQVKILEVEVKAGQELMRLLKAQHQQEIKDLEQETAVLRVTCTETERLLAELRSELRKCRSELSCQAAYTTRLSREKRDVEEKLAASETHREARDLALARAKQDLSEMKKVAADAQARVQSAKTISEMSSPAPVNQHEAALVNLSSVQASVPSAFKNDSSLNDKSILRVDKFLATVKLPAQLKAQRQRELHRSDTSYKSFELARASYHEKATTTNAMALERFKRKVSKDIQNQIAATKVALEELEGCGASDLTLEEDRDELRKLRDELGTKTVAMNETMEESRMHLARLLDGSNQPAVDTWSYRQQPWSSDTSDILRELAQLVDEEPTMSDISNQEAPTHSTSSTIVDDWRDLGSIASTPACLGLLNIQRRESKSEAYRTWVAQRSQRSSELASYRDRRYIERAKQSMRSFHQTLASLNTETEESS